VSYFISAFVIVGLDKALKHLSQDSRSPG